VVETEKPRWTCSIKLPYRRFARGNAKPKQGKLESKEKQHRRRWQAAVRHNGKRATPPQQHTKPTGEFFYKGRE